MKSNEKQRVCVGGFGHLLSSYSDSHCNVNLPILLLLQAFNYVNLQ
jgi:hypothetical protein